MSKKKWYNNDWFVSLIAVTALAAMVIGNYFYNGGRLVW